MGLYNNNPYSNLHELNLDWVYDKLKDVNKAQAAAEIIVPLVDNAKNYAERAEAAEANALTYAGNAHTSELNASDYEDQADSHASDAASAKNDAIQAKNDAISAKNDAVQAKNDAQAAALNAQSDAGDAYLYADAAHQDANAAHLDAVAAAADADRAQLYGASTGVMCFNGEVSAQTAMDVAVGYGTYAVIYFCDNTANSSGIHMIRHKSGNFKNRNLVTNGGSPAPISLTQSGSDVHVYANIADGTMYFIIIGYADA